MQVLYLLTLLHNESFSGIGHDSVHIDTIVAREVCAIDDLDPASMCAHREELLMTDCELRILPADLGDARIIMLLASHVHAARAQTAPGSAHALDLSGLKSPGITVWAAWLSGDLAGVGALKRLSPIQAEIKSMYIVPSARRQGVARAMVAHIIETARGEGIESLSLETGSWPYFGQKAASQESRRL